ncbi:MAG: hypothetical protein PCFJNLEI_03466 [Verrucomicrobiae bacterium]|nr:hypothetical protein [Verrucomicrobiae bacterium]
MKFGRLWGWVPALLLLPAAWAETNRPLNTAVSVSRQFTVHAPGRTLPAALAVFSERLRRAWLAQLELPDSWRDPIVLVIRETEVPQPLQLRVIQVGPVVKYEITGAVPPPLEERDVAAVVVQALCLEFANRNRPPGAATNWQSAVVPLWLAHGLSESLRGQPEWLVPVARRAANSARPPGAADVLEVAVLPADTASRELFYANAWLMTESLLRLPGGARKVQRLLGQLAWTASFADAFSATYAEQFPNAIALEKWWIFQQARLAAVVVPQNLTASATAQRLDELLILPNGYRLTALDRFAEQKWLRAALPGRVLELQGLLARGHPMYREAITGYLEAAQHLAAEKLARYRRAIQRADKLRAEADRHTQAITIALDHAERAFSPGLATNTLQGYFQTLEQAEKFQQQRRNPISDYLDKFDK